MPSDGQTTHRATSAAAAPQTDEANAPVPFGFSTTDIPVGSAETDSRPETYNRGVPLCAVSVIALLIVLGLIVFS